MVTYIIAYTYKIGTMTLSMCGLIGRVEILWAPIPTQRTTGKLLFLVFSVISFLDKLVQVIYDFFISFSQRRTLLLIVLCRVVGPETIHSLCVCVCVHAYMCVLMHVCIHKYVLVVIKANGAIKLRVKMEHFRDLRDAT